MRSAIPWTSIVKTVDATAGGAGDQKSPESFITSSPQEATSSFELILLALITALAAALRFHSLAAKPFWFDEGEASPSRAWIGITLCASCGGAKPTCLCIIFLFTSGLTLEEASFSFGVCRFFLLSRLSP